MVRAEFAVSSVVTSRDASIFFIYAAFGCVLFAACVLAARPRTDTIGFVLAPLLCLALTYENLALGIDALALGGDGATGTALVFAEGVLKLRGAVQAFVIPLWLTALFEITYTVHKRRSANFLLGLFTFDQGHRASHSWLSQGLRYSIWILGVALLLAQITLNAPYMAAPREAPRVARFSFKGNPFGTTLEIATSPNPDPNPNDIDWQDATDLVPWAIFISWALVSGASLWRYGTSISTDINATCINPWAALVVAAVVLLTAWLVSPHAWRYPYAVNAAELLLVAATAYSMRLIESNLRTLEDWDRILTVAGEAVTEALAKRRWILSEQEKEAAVDEAAADLAAASAALNNPRMSVSGAGAGAVRMLVSPPASSSPARRAPESAPHLSTTLESGDWDEPDQGDY